MDILLADSATHAQDWIVEETDVELGDTCETLGSSSRDDLIRERALMSLILSLMMRKKLT